MALTGWVATLDVAFPPQEGSELVQEPPPPLVDPPGRQPIENEISCTGFEVALLRELLEALFQSARISLQKAAEIIGRHLIQKSLTLQPIHDLQDLIPPIDALKPRVFLEIESILGWHGSLRGLQGLLHDPAHI
jgi:hypothetical protein